MTEHRHKGHRLTTSPPGVPWSSSPRQGVSIRGINGETRTQPAACSRCADQGLEQVVAYRSLGTAKTVIDDLETAWRSGRQFKERPKSQTPVL